MRDVEMPRLSESMEEGVVLSWLIADGAQVNEGDELLEIETDKATMTYVAEAGGVLEILVPEGEAVAVGKPIARLNEDGDVDRVHAQPETADHTGAAAAPAAASSHAPAPVQVASPDRVRATPLARRIAVAHGVGLESVGGSGLGGRITKRDVLAAAGIERPVSSPPAIAAEAPAPEPSSGSTAKGEQRIESLSRLQRTIARRMAHSKATVPHLQVQREVVMDGVVEMRSRLKDLAAGEPAPSINDFFIKACALALRLHPKVNGSFQDGEFVLHGRINIGVAVAMDGGLVVPTVFDADVKSLAEIARDTRTLAERVRDGQITPPELAGGTFTISNLGMYGTTAITPVVNPPQAAILGVGSVRTALQRGFDREIVDVQIASLTLSCDHRIIYGADAALFLSSVGELLEAPLRLAL